MIALLAACSGGKAPTDGGVDPIDDPEDTAPPPVDTAPEGASLDATYWLVRARFAYDPALDRVVTYADRDTGALPITFEVTLLDSGVYASGTWDDSTSCTATFEVTSPIAPLPPDPVTGAWGGFEVPFGEATVRDRCRFYGLPGEFAQVLAEHVARWDFAVSVGVLDEDVEAQVRDSVSPGQWDAMAPYLVGGGLRSAIFATGTGTVTGTNGYLGTGIATAYEIDANYALVEDAVGQPVPWPAENVWDTTVPEADRRLGRAMYDVQIGIFAGASVLTSRSD